MLEKMNKALDFLRDKYGVPAGVITSGPEYFQLTRPDGKTVDLLPWRVERRFVELKKIIDGKTLEDISTFRFAAFSNGGDNRKALARELDLAAWLSGSGISRLYAVGNEKACNVIFRLANGMSGCVECGNGLPEGAKPMDRHEIIARRGVASDRLVDSQVPQESIYVWSKEGKSAFTDVDTELFGLPNDAIWVVRAAFAVLSDPSLDEIWNAASKLSLKQSEAAFRSAQSATPIEKF